MFFKGYIKNTTLNKWLSREKNGDIEHVEQQNEALLFHDFEDAIQTVEYLNDSLSDCYMLIQDETQVQRIRQTLEQNQISPFILRYIVETLNYICPYDDVTAEVLSETKEKEPIILIRCYECEKEIQQYAFHTDGFLLESREIA